MTAFVFPPEKILLPTDFSSSSQSALQMASDVAKTYNAELHLLHVVPMFPTGEGTEYFPEAKYLHHGKDHADRQLSKLINELASRNIKARFTVEIGNDVVGNIMMAIKREHIDMIVLSTHGMSGWRPMVFGSIAEKIIRLAQCPLLLFHSVTASIRPEKSTKELESAQTTVLSAS